MPNSKLSAVLLALKTIIEATSITTCYYGCTASSIPTIEFPYAVLDIADGGGITFDINSRNRMVYPVFISVTALLDETGTNPVPHEQMLIAHEELMIAFDSSANRATLAALPSLVDFWVEDAPINPNGKECLMSCKLEMDYPY